MTELNIANPDSLKSKTFLEDTPDHLDSAFNAWVKENKDITIVAVNSGGFATSYRYLWINILYVQG